MVPGDGRRRHHHPVPAQAPKQPYRMFPLTWKMLWSTIRRQVGVRVLKFGGFRGPSIDCIKGGLRPMISQRLMKPAALAFILALAAAPARSENVENCERGFEASDAGNNAGAIVYYSQCLETGELTPKSQALAYFNRGTSFHNEGQYDMAIADFEKVIGLDPEDAGAYNSRGAAYAAKDQLDLAVADYGRALKLQPDHADALFNRGLNHEAGGPARASARRPRTGPPAPARRRQYPEQPGYRLCRPRPARPGGRRL